MFDDDIPGESEAEQSRRLAAASAVCIRCPVRGPCRTAAGELGHPVGVWAGRLTNPSRPVGRSRKELSA
ncbi:WhiB family transcriptional regulator [Rhodococcus rhodochrous]|uniref:WhiB family transcriptional regulator n=1 Tax=Rhodococcus rhodochrous TaxID=1829 RepID=UPI001EE6B685